MKPKTLIIDPANVDADGICASQTTAGAANLLLNGALASTSILGMPKASVTKVVLDYPKQIGITSSGNDSSNTFTVTGIDGTGRSVTENITGPNATTVESTKYFKEITSIAVGGATVGNITIGTVDEIAYIVPLDFYSTQPARISVNITGTISFTVQETFSDIYGSDVSHVSGSTFLWNDITALATKTADTTSTATSGATGIQFIINSYTDTAQIYAYITQAQD